MNLIEEFKKGQSGGNKGLPMGEGLANVSKAVNGVQKGRMYGLPQAGILAQQLLEERLNKHGFYQNKAPGLWTHNTRPISFTLVVDDFEIKYVGKEHADFVLGIFQDHYELSIDWSGTKYIGLNFDWDYLG